MNIADIIRELIGAQMPLVVVVLLAVIMILGWIMIKMKNNGPQAISKSDGSKIVINVAGAKAGVEQEGSALDQRGRVTRGNSRGARSFQREMEVLKKEGDEVQWDDLPPEK